MAGAGDIPRDAHARSRGDDPQANGTSMKTRVIIEYDIPRSCAAGDRVVVRDQEEQRWTRSETVLTLPGLATVTVELVDVSLMPTT